MNPSPQPIADTEQSRGQVAPHSDGDSAGQHATEASLHARLAAALDRNSS